MNVKVLAKTPDELRLEIEGEGHTFCNVLQKALLEDETVETASYDIPHPLVSSPIVYVKMRENRKPEKRPETALKEVAEKIRGQTKEFRVSFEKALEKRQQQ